MKLESLISEANSFKFSTFQKILLGVGPTNLNNVFSVSCANSPEEINPKKTKEKQHSRTYFSNKPSVKAKNNPCP